jgi:hypothetical protein
MTPATIWRDAHRPQARSGGSTALICRNVNVLTSAAPRDRSDPRPGTGSFMRMSQHKMVTLVNGNVGRRATTSSGGEEWNGSGLLGGEVAGVDEQEFAGVKADRPPPGGAHKLVLPDLNRVTADFTEIIDHDSAPFSVRSWVHPHTRINRNAICGNIVVARSLGHTLEARGEHSDK